MGTMTESPTDELTVEALAGHAQMLRRIAQALLGDLHGAEDVEQEAALLALQHPPRDAGAVGGWLTTVTKRLAFRKLRSTRRRARHEQAAARTGHAPGAAEIAERQQLLGHLQRAIEALGRDQRDVVQLHYYEGCSLREIAARQGLPLATVRSRHQRAVARLREMLDRAYGERPRWQHALVGLAMVRPSSVLPPAKLVAVGGLLLLFAASAWWLIGDRSAPPDAGGGPPAVATTSASSAADTGPTADAASDPERVAAGVRVAGRVVDPAGRPVAGAWVMTGRTALRLRRVAVTDDDGAFDAAALPPGHAVCSVARGYAPSALVTIRAPRDAALELQLAAGGMSVRGEVVDASARPMTAGEVLVGREEGPSVATAMQPEGLVTPAFVLATDGDGRFELPGYYAGWFACTPRVAGHAGRRSFHTGRAGETVDVRLSMVEGVELTGTVRDANGRPVAGAQVRVGAADGFAPRATRSAADGTFRLVPVRRSGDKVVAEGTDGSRAEIDLDVAPLADRARWDPVLSRGRVVAGLVVDERGEPVHGLAVDIVRDVWPGWRRRAHTDQGGCFEFCHCLEKGAFRFEVFEPEGVALPSLVVEGVCPADGEAVMLSLPAENRRSARVVGRVCDWTGADVAVESAFLRPVVEGLGVRLTDPTHVLALDARGRFEVTAIPAGAFELIVLGRETGWCRLPLPRVLPGRDLDCGELRLPRPATVYVRASLAPDANVGQCRHLLERLDVPQRIVEERGSLPDRFVVAPGSYRLEVEMLPGPRRDLRFTVGPGEVDWLDVAIDARCRHLVSFALSDDSAAEYLWLELFDTERRALAVRRYVEPDAQGAFAVVLDLLPGSYRMTALASDGSRGGRDLLVNTTAETRGIDIELR